MAPIAGWYDDPRDDASFRYWDGEAWTDQVIPKEQSAQPAPVWHYPGSEPAQGQTWNYAGAPPAQQQTWPSPAPAAAAHRHPSTPDGIPITSWGKRFAARLLDGIFVTLISLPFTGYFFYRLFQALSDQLNDPTHTSFLPTGEVVKWE